MPLYPTVEQMNSWNNHELLQWIQQKKPVLLSGKNLAKFEAAEFSGESFLSCAGNVDIFKDADLPLGVRISLANLGDEVKKGKSLVWM